MEKTALMAHIIMAIPALLIKKGIITPDEWKEAVMESAKLSADELDGMLREMKKELRD